MSTRCQLRFQDKDGVVLIYQHWDGYPEHVLPKIEKAKQYAWNLPRFEADDFAAAYVRATKDEGGGNIRIVAQGSQGYGWLEYIYTITTNDQGQIHVTIKNGDGVEIVRRGELGKLIKRLVKNGNTAVALKQ